MNRLIKAEAFRLRRYIFTMVMCTVVFGIIPPICSINTWKETLGVQLEGSGILIMAVMMILPPIFAETTGKLYDQGKLGFYEIMAGNKTPVIVFSKIMTDGMLFLGMIAMASCGYYTYAGISRGLGSFDHWLVRLLLLIVVFAHIAFCSVLIVLCLRSTNSGTVICFLRFWIVDIALLPFLAWLFGSVFEWPELAIHFSYMSLTNQMMILISEPMHGKIVWHVLLGITLEFAFWYSILDYEMRKRKIA